MLSARSMKLIIPGLSATSRDLTVGNQGLPNWAQTELSYKT